MQFPESWLREFCDPPLDTRQLASTLTMGGFEVEETRPVAPPCNQVVVGHVVTAEPHPNADRLRVCTVDVGIAEPLRIVCGAPNARPGIKVPCALVGAQLPAPAGADEPITIKPAKLRGIASEGMLCSGRELGLSDDHAGLLELADDARPGADIRAVLHLDEAIFSVKLTPNLGHALSVHGLARELAALTGYALKTPPWPAVSASLEEKLPVHVSAPDLCGRFSGRIIRSVDTRAPTPGWMVERLARCGQRSVSALVDISNYVLFEYGQPTHIFDLAKISGELDVRWGRPGESLELLNGNTITVDERVGVIADARGLESLAGIMGGAATAVSDDTRDIYVEAAFWWPQAVAGRSRRYNFSTEAGYRFERGVDPAGTTAAIERITALILEVCGTAETRCGPIDDQQPNMPQREPVRLRPQRAAKVLGVPLATAQCADVFERLGFAFATDAESLRVTPPSWRFDLAIEEDLIEEVARIVGYQSLPQEAPRARLVPRTRSEARRSAFDVRHALATLGYLETINFSFVDESWEHDLTDCPNPIRLLNPIASQLSVMRSSLLGSLLQVVQHNLQRRAPAVRVFEIGRVFRRDATVTTSTAAVGGIDQPLHVGGALYGPRDRQGWSRAPAFADFYDIKGDVEALIGAGAGGAVFEAARHPAFHPGRCARIAQGGRIVGHVGELHPRWRQKWEFPHAPVVFELELGALLQRPLPAAQPVPRQLPVGRDIAVIVADAVTHDRLIASARSALAAGRLLDATVFDVYRPGAVAAGTGGVGHGEKSVALHLVLAAAGEQALTDETIDARVQTVVERLQRDCGARLRA